jgi:UDP-N-acetylmuramoylalanine--D-glutamate ligase
MVVTGLKMSTDLEVNGKRVLVVGLGKSGVASALFLKANGARVTVSDA